MIEHEVTIQDSKGLHARPAARVVAAASAFESTVRLACGEQVVNGKSILGIMILAAGHGARVRIVVDGPDEEQAMARLTEALSAPTPRETG